HINRNYFFNFESCLLKEQNPHLMKTKTTYLVLAVFVIFMVSCKQNKSTEKKSGPTSTDSTQTQRSSEMQKKVDQYATVKLTTDVNQLSNNQKKMLPLLIRAAKIMDTLYWYQTYGHLDSLINTISDGPT